MPQDQGRPEMMSYMMSRSFIPWHTGTIIQLYSYFNLPCVPRSSAARFLPAHAPWLMFCIATYRGVRYSSLGIYLRRAFNIFIIFVSLRNWCTFCRLRFLNSCNSGTRASICRVINNSRAERRVFVFTYAPTFSTQCVVARLRVPIRHFNLFFSFRRGE